MPKGGSIIELPIKNFGGVNLRDAADKVADNEFTGLQNVYQSSKGIFQIRFGSVADVASIPLASRIAGVWRHYGQNGDRFSIYHCEPDSTLLPDNTTDLTLTDVTAADGNIFGTGGSVQPLCVSYSWIGRGMEQTYNSKSRTGFASGNAWANPGHQTITLAAATNKLSVTIPAFPSGITGANIFVSRGNPSSHATPTQMTYMGTITTSGGSLTVSEYIAPPLVAGIGGGGPPGDALSLVSVKQVIDANGKLNSGTYYIGAAWVSDPDVAENSTAQTGFVYLQDIRTIPVSGQNNAITVAAPSSASVNGGQAIYVFISTVPFTQHPGTCIGVIGVGASITIKSIPSHNAQTSPAFMNQAEGSGSLLSIFCHSVNCLFVGGTNVNFGGSVKARFGFLISKDKDGNAKEIFPSRTHLLVNIYLYISTAIYQGDQAFGGGSFPDLHNYAPNIRTKNDLYKNFSDTTYVQPFPWNNTPNDPFFCHHLSLSYFANGLDIPWQTDGYTLIQLSCVKSATQTFLPPIARYIFEYQNSLIVVARDGNQIYASNASAPQNWATGGAGALLRYVTIGDATGSGITAAGIFTPQTEATNNPNQFMIGFKKIGTWMVNAITDPTTSSLVGLIGGQVASTMVQVSGEVGCVAYRTVTQTPLGTIFLGTDCNVYLINRIGPPIRIGTKIQNGLLHLLGNDAAMKNCTATYHDRHYKLSFPSAAALGTSPIVNDSEWWADLRTDEQQAITWVGPHAGRNIGSQVVLKGDSDNLSRLCAHDGAASSFTADDISALDDLGTAITVKITSKIYRFREDAHLKRLLGAFLDMYIDDGYTNNLLFEGFADSDYQAVNRLLSSGGAVWDSSQWNQSNYADASWQGFSFNFGNTNLNGRTFQFRITKSDKAPFLLASSTLLLKPERRRVIA